MSTIQKRCADSVALGSLELDEPLFELGYLVHQGTLHIKTKQSLRTTEKERHVFLFANSIIVCKYEKDEKGKVQFTFKRKIDLSVRASTHCLCTR